MGISLHYSSSGVDLPMKVQYSRLSGHTSHHVGRRHVWMPLACRCCGLPSVQPVSPDFAFAYLPSLSELVKDQENSYVFTDASSLASVLFKAFSSFPVENPALNHFRDLLSKKKGWAENWRECVLPLLQ